MPIHLSLARQCQVAHRLGPAALGDLWHGLLLPATPSPCLGSATAQGPAAITA